MSGPKKLSFFKESPFGAPAPRPPSSDEDSDTEFFSQSKRTYALLAAEEQERKKRKAEQAALAAEEATPATPPSQKKQKTSDHGDGVSSNGNNQEIPEEAMESQKSPIPSSSQFKSKETNAQSVPGATKPSTGEVIELDSDESSVEEIRAGPSGTSQPYGLAKESNGTGSQGLDASQMEATNTSVPSEPTESQEKSATPDPEANVIVSILITSNLPNTNSLIVQRKLSQRLKEPRLEWCRRQDFDSAKTADVILTFRGKQIYDSTTCRALGIGVDGSGNILEPGEKDSIGDLDRRIHMVATTREMLQELRKAKSQRSMGLEEEAPAQPVALPEAAGKKIRLILKSKGREDMKLMIKETQTISKLLYAYRKEYGLEDSSTNVSIHFDGEELNPDRSVGDCDIDDLDTLDVYEN